MSGFGEFLKSRWGLGALALAGVLLAAHFLISGRAAKQPPRVPLRTNTNAITHVHREVGSVPKPPPVAPPPITNGPRSPDILVIEVALPPETNLIPSIFAPAGRLLVCVLVNTVESIHMDTPVIGIVISNLWFDGKLVVPAGTEVHGKAQVDRVRDRIAAAGNWTLVFTNGEELVVQGIALHCDYDPGSRHWGVEDGSAGLKGKVIRSTSWDEIKLFAAAFLSGMSQGVQETEYTIYGSRVRRTIQNSALAGTGAVLDEYARSIAETIKRDGLYVRVEAGAHPFYLYLQQTVDRSAARVGATQRTSPTR